MNFEAKNNPALTYTLSDFIEMQDQDEVTYHNFSILRKLNGHEVTEENVIQRYMKELKSICSVVKGPFTSEEVKNYQYAPDMLAYYLYGSVQLDWIVLLCNGCIDPKEFDMKQSQLYLPRASVLRTFLSRLYNAESDYIDMNREDIKKS